MTSQIITHQSFVTQLQQQIEYPSAGILSKVIFQDKACQYTLFCLAANAEISEHTSTRNATINVLDGRGLLTLSGEKIALEAGVLVLMPANAPHALKAEANLAFLLTLSEKAADS
ncbi:cupin domain-containing protein [Anabaena sp. UHCC 0399]|uniref:cupin domain-containing protein n=1 Tax=Anabaena sp. UHCC 0399 TaxID=3110238 RepID=UPI002B203D78|nr:cupin domain-containing protein [Anabaena sp. UHCC 0399]MEA5568240.1 cupin domain-containing protein [Anabaena sp. UHCC 0399]